MNKLLLFFLSGFFAVTTVQAQQTSFVNVYKVALRNSDAIKEGSEVKGYYFFYASDKVDRKTNEYTLQIMDNNLKKLKEVKFQDSKDVMVLESSFNGTDLIFLLYNNKENTFEYQVYGADGMKKHSYSRQLTRKEDAYLRATYLSMADEEKAFKGLYGIDGQGFISNMPSREGRDFTFQIDYFSSEKKKQWTYIPALDGKRFIGDYLGTMNNVVYLEILKFNSTMDQKPESFVIGLSLETGKQLFVQSTEQGKYKFYPSSLMTLNGNKTYLFGEYFDPNANLMKDKSRGFAFWGIDDKGKITGEKYLSWDLDLGKHLDVSSKGRIDDFGYMFLHNVVQTADGKIYAIGEGYKKAASALGIAATVLGGGSSGISTVKVKVTDLIMLEFDNTLAIKGAKIYDKKSNSVELPGGYEFVSLPLIGKMIKYSSGDFDYAYTQVSKDMSSFTVCYSDFVRGKDYRGATFNAISYNEGKITTDKINTKSNASVSRVLPAAQGQVLLVDYFKKDKKIDVHLEKLN